MKIYRAVIISTMTIVVFALAILGCLKKSEQPPEYSKIRVGYKANSGYQVFFVAESEGLFTKHKVQVQKQEFESTELMLQAIALGQIDATPAGNLEAIAKVHNESPDLFKVYLTLVFDKANAYFSLLVPTNSTFTSLADLKGRKVGTIPGATASFRLRACLKKFMNPIDVTIIQLKPQLQLQAMAAGEVDALYTVDPIITIGQLKGLAKVLIKGPENEYLFSPQSTAGAVIGSQFLSKQPEAAKRFIHAMYEAVDFMRANETQTRKIVAAAAKLDQVVAERMSLIQYWKLGETDFASVKKYLDFSVEAGALDKQPKDPRDLYISADVIK